MRLPEHEDCAERCLAVKKRGDEFMAEGDLENAEKCYREALRIDPVYAEGYTRLGLVLAEQKSYEEAEHYLRKGLSINPRMEQAYYVLGTMALAHWNPDEAVDNFEQAVMLRPDYLDALDPLAKQYRLDGLLERTLECYRQVLSFYPDLDIAYSSLLFTLQYDPDISREDLFAEHLRYAERYESPLKDLWRPHANSRDPDRRLRIGYVSQDFRWHSVAFFILPVLFQRDKSQFEVFCYHDNSIHDRITDRIAALADQFVSCAGMTHEQLAERIRSDGIDILVDLAGHTGNHRLLVFARKPAPVQATWVGYPATTGLAAMDYRFTDRHMDPPGMTERFHTETLLRLPVGAAYWPEPDSPPVSELPALATSRVTFGCLNTLLKINDRVIRLWARILAALPESRLMLAYGESRRATARLTEAFGREGIAAERLVFYPRMSFPDFQTLHHDIDLALDPFPYNGGTTSIHAVWMGVPVITLEGNSAASRYGVALMESLGLPEFIAKTEDEYLALAVEWAGNLPKLSRIRRELRERVSSNLVDNPSVPLVESLERHFREIWKTWVAAPEREMEGISTPSRKPSAASEERAEGCRFRIKQGNELLAQGRFRDAEECYRQALRVRPEYAEGYINLGYVLAEQKLYEDAEYYLRKGVALKPDMEDAFFILGTMALDRRRFDEAMEHFEQAIAIKPDFQPALAHLGNLFWEQGFLERALECHHRQLSWDANLNLVYSNVLMALQYDPELSQEELFAEHLRFAERFEAPLKALWRPHANSRDPDRRLRVGYVSPDFRQHSVAFFILPILAEHDKNRFEIFCYYAHFQNDEITARIAGLADRFIPCAELSDEELAERIRSDGIDILVDLAGHTGDNRLPAFARKPAPVQVTWIGYPATTGLAAMDYRLTDAYMDPPGMTERFHTETLLRLPFGATFKALVESPSVTELPALRSGSVTLACLNNPLKINGRTLRLWARILAALPQARLMLGNVDSNRARTRLIDAFAEEGIAAERLELRPRVPLQDFLALHHDIDLALDPFPYNGGTTTLHSLWMGVPVITLEGNSAVSRGGVTLLEAAGLPEFVAKTEDDYVARAVELAGDPPRLGRIRQGLRERLTVNLIDNAAAPLVKSLESAYREMWNTWLGAAPGEGAPESGEPRAPRSGPSRTDVPRHVVT